MEVPEDEPGFLAWHQSSARLKLRLSFPLNCVQSRACTAKLFFYFCICWHLQTLQESNVLVHVTPMMKGQARNVWKETQTTTRQFCSSVLCSEDYLLSKVPHSLS